jgi:hypothetical protein
MQLIAHNIRPRFCVATGTLRADLSPDQAGFSGDPAMAEFNCFWGLQSIFKPLSIYTVVSLDGYGRFSKWKPIKLKRWKLH